MKTQDMPGAKKDAGESAESPLLSLGLNILIPVIILMRFSAEDRLGPVYGLLVALAFPVIYGLYDFTRRRNFNLFSALGFVGILLTGGVGLLKLDVQWIAIKEASIPLIVGIVVLGSLKTRFPLVRKLLGKMIKLDLVDAALREKGTAELFERQLVRATYIVGASFFLSALLNYVLRGSSSSRLHSCTCAVVSPSLPISTCKACCVSSSITPQNISVLRYL